MKRTIVSLLLSMIYILAFAQTEGTLQERLEVLMSDTSLKEAQVGICVRTADGRTIADINAGRMLVPASNMKLLSTGTALQALGADYRYETRIGYSGEVVDGVLQGNLHIIGGGDPLLGSKDSIATPLEKTFSQWEKMLREAGIRRIEGHVVGDGRWLDGPVEEPTWLWNDLGTYYGTGVTGLMLYENMQSFNVSAGVNVGDDVKIEPSYPVTPWMQYRYECSTGEKGTGDKLYMYTSEFAPIAAIRGTFGVDRAAKRVDCSNKFPEYTCADMFVTWLDKRGIDCSEGAADYRLCLLPGHEAREDIFCPQSELKIIGSTLSPSLGRIVYETNHASNNLFAETLLRTLGEDCEGSSSYEASYVAVDRVLKDMGVDTSYGVRIQDGSGLSRQNYVSPDFFCRFLAAMLGSEAYPEFLRSLPVPGGNGSLQYNMKGQPETLRSRIKVKSGSMNGVRCYSGYILPTTDAGADVSSDDVKANTLIVSIMTNNCTAPTWKVRPLLDKVLIEIAQ